MTGHDKRSGVPRFLALSAAILWTSCQATTGTGAGRPSSAGDSQSQSGARGPRVYVSNEESTEISVVDGTTDALLTRVFVGKRPRGIKVSPDGKSLFVALSGSPIAPPGTDESRLPPADRAADGIAVVDLATQKLQRTLSTGEDPESFDISSDGNTLYVSHEDVGTASVVRLPSGEISAVVKVGGEPGGGRLRPGNK